MERQTEHYLSTQALDGASKSSSSPCVNSIKFSRHTAQLGASLHNKKEGRRGLQEFGIGGFYV